MIHFGDKIAGKYSSPMHPMRYILATITYPRSQPGTFESMICPAFSEVGYVSSFPGESYLSLLSFPSFLSTKSELCHKHQCYLVCPQPPNHQQVDAGDKACKWNVNQPQSGPLRVPVMHAWKLTSWTQKWRLGRWPSFSYGWFLGSMLIFRGVSRITILQLHF